MTGVRIQKHPMRKYTIVGVSTFTVGILSIIWQFFIMLELRSATKVKMPETIPKVSQSMQKKDDTPQDKQGSEIISSDKKRLTLQQP